MYLGQQDTSVDDDNSIEHNIDVNSALVKEVYAQMKLPKFHMPDAYRSKLATQIELIERVDSESSTVVAIVLFEDNDIASFEVERNYISE